MFDHVTIRASDHEASERFYATVLRTVGIEQTHSGVDRHTGEQFREWDDFSLSQADDDNPVTRRLHIGFAAPSRAHVDEFWRVGTEAGYRDDGAPGPRPQYGRDYYGSFLLDPDGNSAEAVHHRAGRTGIDHIWMRVADVPASTRFYETIARYAGFRVRPDTPERTHIAGRDGSFSVVAGPPTEHVHIAFPVSDDAIVEAFHRAATAAGYRDNGRPGERPEYHVGYYAAFVLDPDGNNVELVNHNR